MPKFFSVLSVAMKPATVTNPEKPSTEVVWLDDRALYCLLDTARRTGVTLKELLSYIVKDWYGVSFDITAPHLRWEIAQTKHKTG